MAKRARANTNRETRAKALRGDLNTGGPKRSARQTRQSKAVAEDREDPHIINRAEMADKPREAREDKQPVNDAREGIIRDPIDVGNGQLASYVRDVGVHDVDYDPQVRKVVLVQDGKRKVVPAAEINTTVAPPVVETRRPKREPSKTFPKGHPGNLVPGEGR